MDQPTQGDRRYPDHTRLLVKLMNPRVSKSLTRSAVEQPFTRDEGFADSVYRTASVTTFAS